jgi:hypothetical protein
MSENRFLPDAGLRVVERLEVVVHGGLSGVLLAFAVLKEEPLFWRNSGGWPWWFREIVRFTFHPLIVIQVVVLIAFTIRLLKKREYVVERIALLVFLWLLASAPIFLSVIDNIEDFMKSS